MLLVNWLLASCWDVHTFVLPILGHERGLSASVIGAILGALIGKLVIYLRTRHHSAVGLDEFRQSYPHQLSGGMAQRVALIRTMINDPEVFLLDEPLGALDAFTRMHMQDELLNMWVQRKRMMLMVTHDIDEAIYMGMRVLVMAPRPGRIREDITIDMPYPRNRTSKKFLEYRSHVMEMLDFGWAEA